MLGVQHPRELSLQYNRFVLCVSTAQIYKVAVYGIC